MNPPTVVSADRARHRLRTIHLSTFFGTAKISVPTHEVRVATAGGAQASFRYATAEPRPVPGSAQLAAL